MRRLVNEQDGRFWEVARRGAVLARRYGKIGAAGRNIERDMGSRLAARWHLERLAREKLAEGFAPGEPVEQSIRGDGDEGEGALPGRAAVAARDELAEVQSQLEAARGGAATKLQQRQERLLERNAEALLGDLAELTDLLELEWRAGYIAHARVGLAPRRVNARVRAKQLLPDMPLYQALGLLVAELCALDSARELEALTLFSLGSDSFEEAFAALAAGAPAKLRSVAVANTGQLKRAVELRSRDDPAAGARVGTLALSETVRELRLEPPLGGGQLGLLCRGGAPGLEQLDLSCGAGGGDGAQAVASGPFQAPGARDGASALVDDLAPLLSGEAFPRLVRLALRDVADHQAVARALAAPAPLLSRLRTLELGGGFDDDDAVLLAESGALGALEHLAVHNTAVGPDGVDALERAGVTLLAEDKSDAVLTIEQVRRLSPDKRAEAAARSVAQPSKWRDLGRAPGQLFGLCQGSSQYEVSVELPSLVCRCDCPSRKRPCKHALALLLLAVDGAVEPAEPPPWVPQQGQRDNWLEDPDDPPF